MITRHFKNMLAMIAESQESYRGILPARSVGGKVYYLNGYFYFPVTRALNVTISADGAGISVGSGSKAESEMDYNLENTITSGIAISLSNTTFNVDTQSGQPCPYVKYKVTVTNTGEAPITVTEVGYKQTFRVASKPLANQDLIVVFLVDRTLLDNPIVIAAGDAGIVEYTIMTRPVAPTIVRGVQIVSFTYGSDEQVAAMIDAAHDGIIDLQTDGGWQIGDMRTIHIGAFEGGKSIQEQDVNVAIASFDDYNSCGCVVQIDFADTLKETIQINNSSTNVGGYGGSRMYTTTLPAMVDALPSWLRSRLITFDVLVSAGNRSTEIVTVGNNKLALRSEVEVAGTTAYSAEGEGVQLEYYKDSNSRKKPSGNSGLNGVAWWTRSPALANASSYAFISNSGGVSTYVATQSSVYFAPFCCL